MTWLPTFLAWGAFAASIPIALHFFFRSRYRVVHWAAMEFLLKSIQETSRRLKFQELLLLLLRILILVLLALVLALTIWRIVFRGDGGLVSNLGGGGSVDAVILLDVSASMNAKEGTRTRFDLARDAAREVIDSLPAASTVRVILATDKGRLVGPRQPANLDQARELLDKVEVSSRPTDFRDALEEAGKALGLGSNPNKEVYLISDMQKQGLLQSAAIKPIAEGLERNGTKLYAIHCGTQAPKNATIEGIVPPSGILHTGTRMSFTVLVRNTSGQPLRDLQVSLKLAGQDKGLDARPVTLLQPNELKPVPLSIELKQGGHQVLQASVEPDDLAIDNHFDQVVYVHEQVRVLVVDGAPNAKEPTRAGNFFLMEALLPVAEGGRDKYFLKTRTVVPRNATPLLLAETDVVILVDVALREILEEAVFEGGFLSAAFLDELEKFVKAGKSVLIFAGPHTLAAHYNEELARKRPLLPLRLGSVVSSKSDDKVPITADTKSLDKHGLLASFTEGPLARILGALSVRRYLDTADPSSAEKDKVVQVILKYSTGRPALALRHVERGKVLLCTTTADPRWNDWLPLGHVSVPLVHETLAHLLPSDVQAFNRRVGEPLTWTPSDRTLAQRHLLTPPVGDVVRLGLATGAGGPPRYQVTDTDRAGVYRIQSEEDDPNRVTTLDRNEKRDRGEFFAVTPSPDESQTLEPGTEAEVNDGLGVPVTHLKAGQGRLTDQLSERRAQEWTGLLIALLVLVLAETALAFYCGRSG